MCVTEPETHEIQRFKAAGGAHPSMQLPGSISLPKGAPERLVVGSGRHAVCVDQRSATTLKISLRSLHVEAYCSNIGQRDQGLALAPSTHLLILARREGKVIALDTSESGKEVSQARVGASVDLIAWNPNLRDLYAPAATNDTLGVRALTAHGQLQKICDRTVGRAFILRGQRR